MSGITCDKNLIKIITNDNYFEFKTEYNIEKITTIIENDKRIIIITNEKNGLFPIFIFNKKTNFFKQITFLNEETNQIKMYNGERINKENKIFIYQKESGLTKINFYFKHGVDINKKLITNIYLEVTRKRETRNYKITIKYIEEKILKTLIKNSILGYTGFDYKYYFAFTLFNYNANVFIFDVKNISCKNFIIRSKKNSKKEIVNFVINNLTKNKSKFLKNKMIFEAIGNA